MRPQGRFVKDTSKVDIEHDGDIWDENDLEWYGWFE
jgi:hypothetical protein